MAKPSMLEAVKIEARVCAFVASRAADRDAHPSADQGAFAYPIQSAIVESTPESLAIDMTACEFARRFRQIGEPEIGALMTCGVDFAVNAVLRPSWDFQRTQTQMQGAPFRGFRWRLKKHVTP